MSEKHWNPKRQYEIETGKEAMFNIENDEYMFAGDYILWLQKEYMRSNKSE